MMILLARTGNKDTARSKALSVFLVDLQAAQAEGSVTIQGIDAMINHNTNHVFMENLRVPSAMRIGEEGEGFKAILTSMNAERILIASECIGDGRYLLNRAVEYAKEREVFGRPIGMNQGIQFPLAKAYASLEAARLMVYRAADLYDNGKPCGPEANMAKMLAADASWEAANACFQTFGGFAFAREYDIERKFRETRLYQIAPISTNLILTNLAEKVLGLPRSF
jgi:alkylation response protein AidB-like acyl-CoA dehydrogenase